MACQSKPWPGLRGGLVASAARAGLLAVTLLALTAPGAFAHAAFLESTPPPGVRLDRAPETISLRFTEPLNRKLSEAKLLNLASGERIATELAGGAERALVLRPSAPLATAAYRVEWRTVSPEDGHTLQGTFSFGVRTLAPRGEQRIEQSPLARSGWVRISLRGLFYAALVFFAGGVLTATLLARRGAPAGWLVPQPVASALERAGDDPGRLAERLWARTIDAGLFAASSAAGLALFEGFDAAGGFGLDGLANYLLSNVAGLGRVGTVVALGAALAVAGRSRVGASACVGVALLGLSISGHANSAEPRLAAVATDWVHLVAGSIWLGGIAQVAASWWTLPRGAPRDVRRQVLRAVLERFGILALPAFLVVVASGLVNALIQLGEPDALWQTGYGQVLSVKVVVVAVIALASYWHALRLRPRLLVTDADTPTPLERRHWRVLRSEPFLGVAVVVAAALLVAFPLPPRQLVEATEPEAALAAAPACDPCPQRKPAARELAVAEQAGSSIAAVWLRRARAGLSGELRLLDRDEKPVPAEARIGLARQRSCGPGCWRFTLDRDPGNLEVRVPEKGKVYTARIPTRWRVEGDQRARRLLARAERTMRALRSVRERETATSGPGSFAGIDYRLRAPDRLAYRTDRGVQSVAIGRRQWVRTADLAWSEREYAGGLPFRTRRWFRWSVYAQSVRLLTVERSGGRRIAELALMDEGTPLWLRLRIDLATMRVVAVRSVTGGHFMSQRFLAFNRPLRIVAPEVEASGR